MATDTTEVESPDFSKPWKFSDVVLVVEEQKFHVHRAILAFWSPVFEKMFTSEFQEKEKNEIPLPGKKASEIRELLSFAYPSLTGKAITAENCYFLLKLALEYQMVTIAESCENFMVDRIKAKPKDSILSDLVFAQTFKLEKLKLASGEQAHCLSLEELKKDEMYEQVQPENLKEIKEGIITRLQRELEGAKGESQLMQRTIDDMKKLNAGVKSDSLRQLDYVTKVLLNHAASKEQFSYIGCTDTDSYLRALKCDRSRKTCTCESLGEASEYLVLLKRSLECL